jgi:hypothetical protein
MIGNGNFIFADMAVLLLIGAVFLVGGIRILRAPVRPYRFVDGIFQIAVSMFCLAGIVWLDWAIRNHRL